MALQYKTKAGRLTNLTDARFFNAQGVSYLGFSVDALNEYAVSLKDLKEIKQWLFEPRIVLECGEHQDRTEMVHLANEIFAEAVEVSIDHSILRDDHFIYPVFVRLAMEDLQRTRTRKTLRDCDEIEAVILYPGNDDFNWEDFRTKAKGTRNKIRQLKRHIEVYLELPFETSWLLEAIELLEPTGIHIRGDKEDKPGLSKVDEYAELLELIEVEE